MGLGGKASNIQRLSKKVVNVHKSLGPARNTSKKQKDESDLESKELKSNSTSMALTSTRSLPSGAWMYKSTAKQACEFGIGTAVGQGTSSLWMSSASIFYLSAFSCTGLRIELGKELDS